MGLVYKSATWASPVLSQMSASPFYHQSGSLDGKSGYLFEIPILFD